MKEASKQARARFDKQLMDMNSVSSRLGRKTVELHNICKSFGERTIIDDFTYIFLRDDRIGIVGDNGCGKSTLMKIIAGQLEPDSGSVEVGETVRIGYFMQENEPLDDSLTVLEFVRSIGEYVTTADGKATASQMCEKFLFTPKQQWTPISKLSGGEKRRLYLLSVLMSAPNVLILDEPTNDLDIETLEILEEYLDGFAGIVITVSHDRYFLDRVVDRIFAFEAGGHLTQYEGGYTDYRDKCVSSIYNVESNGTSDAPKSKAAGQVKKAYNSHEDNLTLQTVTFQVPFVCAKIIPGQKSDATDHDQKHDHNIDQWIGNISCQRWKCLFRRSKYVKTCIAKSRYRMED